MDDWWVLIDHRAAVWSYCLMMSDGTCFMCLFYFWRTWQASHTSGCWTVNLTVLYLSRAPIAEVEIHISFLSEHLLTPPEKKKDEKQSNHQFMLRPSKHENYHSEHSFDGESLLSRSNMDGCLMVVNPPFSDKAIWEDPTIFFRPYTSPCGRPNFFEVSVTLMLGTWSSKD